MKILLKSVIFEKQNMLMGLTVDRNGTQKGWSENLKTD